MPELFLSATGTDVGKTYISGELLAKMKSAGIDVGYYKFVLSGSEEKGYYHLGDPEYVKKRATLLEPAEDLVSYVYKQPLSPHLAAQLEGHPARLEKIEEDYKAIKTRHAYTLIEGCGNLYCPLCEEPYLEQSELVKHLDLATILVAPAGLGGLGAIATTLAYAESKGIRVLALVLNHFDEEDLICADNLRYAQAHFNLPVFPCPTNGEIGITSKALVGLFEKGAMHDGY